MLSWKLISQLVNNGYKCINYLKCFAQNKQEMNVSKLEQKTGRSVWKGLQLIFPFTLRLIIEELANSAKFNLKIRLM